MLTDAQEEALAFDRSLCVTASAGTGKTHVLVRRYIHLLEAARCDPSDILALTFTEKAAFEMKDRLLKECYSRTGAFWDDVRDRMMWARVGTIHSFCYHLVREFAAEAGVDPSVTVIDDHELDLLLDDGIRRLFSRTGNDEIQRATTRCLTAWGEHRTRQSLYTLYHRRAIALPFFQRLADDPASVTGTWMEEYRAIRGDAAADLRESPVVTGAVRDLLSCAERYGGGADAATRYLRKVRPALEEFLDASSSDEICDAFLSIVSVRGRKNMGSARIFGDDLGCMREAYGVVQETLRSLPPAIRRFDPAGPSWSRTLDLTRDLGTMFTAFAEHVRDEKYRSGQLDFQDMILIADRLVRSSPSICETLHRRFRYVMVDEFQDTDLIQTGIITRILSFGDDHPDRLFVVGDPKQSIYLFRDADVTQFRETRDAIDGWGGREIALDENFRSTPAIVSFVNHLFERVFAKTGRPWDFPYEQVRPTKDRECDAGSVEVFFTVKGGSAEESALFEYTALARRIESRVQAGDLPVYWDRNGNHLDTPRPATYGDIAILIEKRTHLDRLLHALEERGVPCRVHGGAGFYQAREIIDLRNVCAFLCNPADDIALYGTLRSPYFGLSDADLFRICRGRARGLFEHLAESADDRAAAAYRQLARWISLVRHVSTSELLSTILDESGVRMVHAALPDGDQTIANIEKLIDFVRSRERPGFYSTDRFVAELDALIGNESREGEAETGRFDDAVTVMTVHGSKGLEFPIVFVPGITDAADTRSGPVAADFRRGIGIQIPSDENPGTPEKSLPYLLIENEYRQKDLAEHRRLFYVAATRARDHLFLSGVVPDPSRLREHPDEYTRRVELLLGHLGHGIPAEGETVVHEVAPGVRVTVTGCTAGECMPDGGAPRAPISPGPVDGRAHPPLREIPRAASTRRRFSATGIMEYLRPSAAHKNTMTDRSLFEPPARTDLREEGEIIHEIFSGRPAEPVLRRRGIAPDGATTARYRAMYDRFRSSALMRDAAEEYTEFPFCLAIDGFTITGSIDRLVRTGSGWVVIDYKTGRTVQPGDYEVQMAIYALAARQITGTPVRSFIYSTATDEFVELHPDLGEMEERIAGACRAMGEEDEG